jgi:hypothetical protein
LRVKGSWGKPPFGNSMDKPAGNSIGGGVSTIKGLLYTFVNNK